ncbi:MAG: hypothetical protein ACRDVN_00540 [Jiangellaceae bacterium]
MAAVRRAAVASMAVAAVASATIGIVLTQTGDDGAQTRPSGDGTAATYSPSIDPAGFTTAVDNLYFPLPPGARWVYEGRVEDGLERTVVEVTGETRDVMGVTCVVVRDTVTLDGEVIEDTFDWFAQAADGAVWYFGEETYEYEDGEIVSTEGAWEAGVDGAQAGIVMPAEPRVGDSYRQEYYEGEAEDAAEVLSLTESATVPVGTYADVLMTEEVNPLEPDVVEHKYYARGVGPILTVQVQGGSDREELVEAPG